MASQLTLSVLSNLASKSMACGEPNFSVQNSSFTGFMAVVTKETHNFNEDGTVTLKPEYMASFKNAQNVMSQASSGSGPTGLAISPPTSLTQTITTTGANIGQYVPINIPIPNDNTYFPPFIPNGPNNVPYMPYIGDPLPTFPVPGTGKIEFPIVIKPNLEELEEGVHEIKGGKVIIKKIMVTDEQLEEALKEELGHEPSEEEKATLKQEIEDLNASEEREV